MYNPNRRYEYINKFDYMLMVIETRGRVESVGKRFELLLDHSTYERIIIEGVHIAIKYDKKRNKVRVQCYADHTALMDFSRWILGAHDKGILVWFKDSVFDFRVSNLKMIEKK